jgi:hypothetical protein
MMPTDLHNGRERVGGGILRLLNVELCQSQKMLSYWEEKSRTADWNFKALLCEFMLAPNALKLQIKIKKRRAPTINPFEAYSIMIAPSFICSLLEERLKSKRKVQTEDSVFVANNNHLGDLPIWFCERKEGIQNTGDRRFRRQ